MAKYVNTFRQQLEGHSLQTLRASCTGAGIAFTAKTSRAVLIDLLVKHHKSLKKRVSRG